MPTLREALERTIHYWSDSNDVHVQRLLNALRNDLAAHPPDPTEQDLRARLEAAERWRNKWHRECSDRNIRQMLTEFDEAVSAAPPQDAPARCECGNPACGERGRGHTVTSSEAYEGIALSALSALSKIKKIVANEVEEIKAGFRSHTPNGSREAELAGLLDEAARQLEFAIGGGHRLTSVKLAILAIVRYAERYLERRSPETGRRRRRRSDMKIIIEGPAGSGKTWLAEKLGEFLASLPGATENQRHPEIVERTVDEPGRTNPFLGDLV